MINNLKTLEEKLKHYDKFLSGNIVETLDYENEYRFLPREYTKICLFVNNKKRHEYVYSIDEVLRHLYKTKIWNFDIKANRKNKLKQIYEKNR